MSKSNQNAESRMSGSFAWVCICILEGGHFSFLNADAGRGSTGLALRQEIWLMRWLSTFHGVKTRRRMEYLINAGKS
jgi:hypothetical protein